ncbi:hypothetical protein I79_026140 [Cricetulus griseus]|uniref:Uncharacterized protein n=1 Tax=Cricetulus griseus TaxID=10029 RepID=G3IQ50_CRIGR|nr:hypothetical protein I79_026140 [Cricetulus griseus]
MEGPQGPSICSTSSDPTIIPVPSHPCPSTGEGFPAWRPPKGQDLGFTLHVAGADAAPSDSSPFHVSKLQVSGASL